MNYLKNIKKGIRIKDTFNYFIIIVMLAVPLLMSTFGNLPRSSAGLLAQMAYSILLAVSLNLVVGFLGELSLGHAGFMCVGAYIGCYIAKELYNVMDSKLLVLIISMLIGGLVAAVFGFIIGLPALRLKGDYLAIVTLAFGEIVRTIFKNLPTFGAALGLSTKKYGKDLYIVALVTVLISLFLIQNIIRSKHGRAITAIRDNEIAAKAMGINITYYKLFVFVFAAFFAGMAGVIYGSYVTPVVYSFFSFNYSIEILVMVVLGGMGNITGSIISAVFITYLNFQLQTQLSGDLAALKYLVYAIILIVVVIFNNAPALKSVRERFSITNKLREKRIKNPEKQYSDTNRWDVVTTKIRMDEILTTDVKQNDPFKPDKPQKGGK